MTENEQRYLDVMVRLERLRFAYANDDNNREQYVPEMNHLREEEMHGMERILRERNQMPVWDGERGELKK
jgi:hypothetical protein